MPSVDRLVLRVAIPVTLAVGILSAVIGALVASDPDKALLGSAIGTVIVITFFTVGQLVVGGVLRTNPDMAMTVALMVYLLKIGALFIGFAVRINVGESDVFNTCSALVPCIIPTLERLNFFCGTR